MYSDHTVTGYGIAQKTANVKISVPFSSQRRAEADPTRISGMPQNREKAGPYCVRSIDSKSV